MLLFLIHCLVFFAFILHNKHLAQFIMMMMVMILMMNFPFVCICVSAEYWAGDDIMDSETAAAFELFMAESQQASSSSSSSRTVVPNCHSEIASSHP